EAVVADGLVIRAIGPDVDAPIRPDLVSVISADIGKAGRRGRLVFEVEVAVTRPHVEPKTAQAAAESADAGEARRSESGSLQAKLADGVKILDLVEHDIGIAVADIACANVQQQRGTNGVVEVGSPGVVALIENAELCKRYGQAVRIDVLIRAEA